MKYITQLEEKLTDENELRKAFSLARKINVIELPVFSSKDPEKYLGMVDLRAYMTFSYDILRSKLKYMILRYRCLTNSEFDPKEAAKIMIEQNYRAVPIIDDENPEKLVGICYDNNILEYLSEIKFGRKVKIKSLGLKPPITIEPNDTIAKAITLMRKNSIGRLPVVKDGKLVGIVTRMSIFNLIISLDKERPREGEFVGEKYSIFSYPIKEVMDYPVYSLPPEASIFSAIQTMLKYNIRGIVIAVDEKPVGVITSKDIISLFVNQYLKEMIEKEIIHEIRCDDPEIKMFIERCVRIKRFPEGSFLQIFCLKRATTKNIYDIKVKLTLPSGETLIYTDVARGKIEAYRRVKKAIDVIHYECFEKKLPY